MPIERSYVAGRFGQLHLWDTGAAGAAPPLYCLHATAYSGQTFLPLMRELAPHRRVIALDTPGYGGSDGPDTQVPFEAYADALAEAIRSSRPDSRPVDLFGYHTGVMLAVEIAARHPELVRRIVLIGIPYFVGADRDAWRARLVHETALDESFEQFRQRWDYFIRDRTPGLALDRAFACFVDELRAYPREWWAHDALFDYAATERLPRVVAPVRLINLASALAGPSRAAAALMPKASVVELPQLGGAPFDLGASVLAGEFEAFLR